MMPNRSVADDGGIGPFIASYLFDQPNLDQSMIDVTNGSFSLPISIYECSVLCAKEQIKGQFQGLYLIIIALACSLAYFMLLTWQETITKYYDPSKLYAWLQFLIRAPIYLMIAFLVYNYLYLKGITGI